jgi:hypothetical protein
MRLRRKSGVGVSLSQKIKVKIRLSNGPLFHLFPPAPLSGSRRSNASAGLSGDDYYGAAGVAG